MKKITTAFFACCLFAAPYCFSKNWLVGPTRPHTKPSQVSALVQNGDTVSIDAGTYASDVAYWTASTLLLRGVGGYAHLESNGMSWGDKAIWVIGGDNTKVEWIEFSECTSTSQNGAGIRQEAKNLTVRHCYFHDNENGILAGTYNPSTILIEFTEFGHNGAGDGYSHNLYINHIDTLIFRYNYSHHCDVGHELKSRAHVTILSYNRFSNEATGSASREIDLPDGGTAILIGNIIEQGPASTNSGIIGFGAESLTNIPPHQLYLINNTIVNNKSNGTFVSIPSGTTLYKAYNNIFAGSGTLLSGSAIAADTSHNWRVTSIAATGFTNAAGYDYTLTPSSSAINSGTSPGLSTAGYPLLPVMEYKHPANSITRAVNGTLDKGAHESFFGTGIISINKSEDAFHFWFNNGSIICSSALSEAEINLFDLNGRNFFSHKISRGISTLDIGNLSKGIYCIRASSEDQIISRKIFIY